MFILKVRWEVARSGAQPLALEMDSRALGGGVGLRAIKNRSNI